MMKKNANKRFQNDGNVILYKMAKFYSFDPNN